MKNTAKHTAIQNEKKKKKKEVAPSPCYTAEGKPPCEDVPQLNQYKLISGKHKKFKKWGRGVF